MSLNKFLFSLLMTTSSECAVKQRNTWQETQMRNLLINCCNIFFLVLILASQPNGLNMAIFGGKIHTCVHKKCLNFCCLRIEYYHRSLLQATGKYICDWYTNEHRTLLIKSDFLSRSCQFLIPKEILKSFKTLFWNCENPNLLLF